MTHKQQFRFFSGWAHHSIAALCRMVDEQVLKPSKVQKLCITMYELWMKYFSVFNMNA